MLVNAALFAIVFIGLMIMLALRAINVALWRISASADLVAVFLREKAHKNEPKL